MATFVVCTHCGKTLEIATLDQLPEGWQRAGSALSCPPCVDELAGDVLDKEVTYPQINADTLDESAEEAEECAICRGPCQGH